MSERGADVSARDIMFAHINAGQGWSTNSFATEQLIKSYSPFNIIEIIEFQNRQIVQPIIKVLIENYMKSQDYFINYGNLKCWAWKGVELAKGGYQWGYPSSL